jgi:hypothetical protein
MMQTRFSLEIVLDEPERLRLFQAFQYLIEFQNGKAVVSRELADHLAARDTAGSLPERRFAELIGTEPPGFAIEARDEGAVRIFDIDGSPNLRMLCNIIANAIPRVLPLEFSFALVDEVEHRFSGGLVVMTLSSAEIQTTDSMLARRGRQSLH